jgi:hypothetical protein
LYVVDRRFGALLTLLILVAAITVAAADPIRKGALMQVKPDTIWFQEADRLAHWQELNKGGNDTPLSSFRQQVLSQREAWQFLKPLKVKILSYEAATGRVNVEMRTDGRLQGTTWWLDASALAR